MNESTISIMFLGHIDHGKSTVMSRLLYELGIFTERDKKRVTTKKGKIKWELLLDQEDERK